MLLSWEGCLFRPALKANFSVRLALFRMAELFETILIENCATILTRRHCQLKSTSPPLNLTRNLKAKQLTG